MHLRNQQKQDYFLQILLPCEFDVMVRIQKSREEKVISGNTDESEVESSDII